MNMIKFLHIVILMLCSTLVNAQTTPAFCTKKNLFDAKDRNTLGLTCAPKAETVTVFCSSDSSDHYANGVVMAAYKGQLYCMWQSSAKDEDSADTWVAYSHSSDEGKTWSKPRKLCNTTKEYFCTSGGWLSCNDRLVAFVNVWQNDSTLKACSAYYTETTDGKEWSALKEVKWADGTPMNGIFEQDPHRMPNGRIIGAVHLMPGMILTPIYTDDPTGRGGWEKGKFKATPNGKQSAELEPSFFVQKDSTIVMTMRDQRSSYRVLAATSHDNGETWSDATPTNMPDSRAKQCAGNLSDGTAYIVNNPISEKKPRTPLVITLSDDGKTFDKAYLLRSGNSNDLPTQRYHGKYKTIGYSYPKAMEHNGWLYISYSTNKEKVEYTRVKIGSNFISNFR